METVAEEAVEKRLSGPIADIGDVNCGCAGGAAGFAADLKVEALLSVLNIFDFVSYTILPVIMS